MNYSLQPSTVGTNIMDPVTDNIGISVVPVTGGVISSSRPFWLKFGDLYGWANIIPSPTAYFDGYNYTDIQESQYITNRYYYVSGASNTITYRTYNNSIYDASQNSIKIMSYISSQSQSPSETLNYYDW